MEGWGGKEKERLREKEWERDSTLLNREERGRKGKGRVVEKGKGKFEGKGRGKGQDIVEKGGKGKGKEKGRV